MDALDLNSMLKICSLMRGRLLSSDIFNLNIFLTILKFTYMLLYNV